MSHLDHLEAEYREMRERADREDRRGMLWALLIVAATSGGFVAYILSL